MKLPQLSLRDLFWLVLVVGLALAIGWVAIDAARRFGTLEVVFEGHGVPTKSPPAAFALAEWNIAYLLGLFVGTGAGMGLALFAFALIRLSPILTSKSP